MSEPQEMISVIQAFIHSEKIEFCDEPSGKWLEVKAPCWNWHRYKYRVKPKPMEIFLNVYPGAINNVAYKDKPTAEQFCGEAGTTKTFREVIK